MKKIKFIITYSLIGFVSYGQGINNLWLMGYASWAGPPYGGINLDFTSGAPIISYVSRPMYFATTNANICDSSENLLFYSNGIYIANANNDTMLNGSGLNPSNYTTQWYQYGLYLPQGNLILPFPGDSTKYLLFHETKDDGVNHSDHLFVTTIDMTLDGGLGGVISKNISVINDSLILGEITTCKHGNGRDWWIIVHRINSDLFYKLLITPAGITSLSTQNIGTLRNVWFGQSVFSPDGNRFAHYNVNTDLDVYDFDRCTGDLSNWRHVNINDSANGGGIAFSPNSNIIYVSSILYIYQFDATISNLVSTQTTVAVWDGYNSPFPPYASTFFLSQLAPDNKIYINCSNSTVDIHVINNPDNIGIGCDVCQHCVHLPAFNAFTIPNHPNYFLGAMPGSICDSLTGVDLTPPKIDFRSFVYPNPCNEKTTLVYQLMEEKNGLLEIYDSMGNLLQKIVLQNTSNEFKLNTFYYKEGIYFYQFLERRNIKDSGKFAVIHN